MQNRDQLAVHDNYEEFIKEILSHPTIIHYLTKCVDNRKVKGQGTWLDITKDQIIRAASYLRGNLENRHIFIELLDNESVKSLLFEGKCWPSLTASIAESISSLGKDKTLSIVDVMLDGNVKKYIAYKSFDEYGWSIDFDSVKKWGEHDTKEIALLLSNSRAEVLDKAQLFDLYYVKSFQQLESFVNVLLRHDAIKFMKLQWIDQRNFHFKSEELLQLLTFLNENETQLKKMVADDVITHQHIQNTHLIFCLPKKQRLNQLSCHPMKTIARHFKGSHLFLYHDEKVIQDLIDQFGKIQEKTLDFLFRHAIVGNEEDVELKYSRSNEFKLIFQNNCFLKKYKSFKEDSTWRAWIMAGSFLSIRKAIEINSEAARYIIIVIRNCNASGAIKVTQSLSTILMFGESTTTEIKNSIDKWIIGTGQNQVDEYIGLFNAKIICEVARLVSDYRIRYMLEQELLQFHYLVKYTHLNYRCIGFSVEECFIGFKSHIHKVLTDLKNELNKPEWKKFGFWQISRPDGIQKIIQALNDLPLHHNSKRVDELLIEVLAILEEKQKPLKGEKRDPRVTKLYTEKYKELMKWHPESMKSQKALTCDEIEVRKAARLLAQVSRHRACFFTQEDQQDAPITMLPDEILTQIAFETRGNIGTCEAIQIVEENFFRPKICTPAWS